MKRIAVLLALVLGSAAFLTAQDAGKGHEMIGTLCDQKCVKQDSGKAACDLSCTDKSGERVFVDDNGKATRVANPEICEGKMGKKVKVHGTMKDPDRMELWDVVLADAG